MLPRGWVDLNLKPSGATVQLNCVDATHAQHILGGRHHVAVHLGGDDFLLPGWFLRRGRFLRRARRQLDRQHDRGEEGHRTGGSTSMRVETSARL